MKETVLTPSQLPKRLNKELSERQRKLLGLTASQLVAEWSGTIAQLKCNIHLDDAVEMDIPTLSDVNATFGNLTSLDIISEHILSVMSFAGVDLTKEQGQETALAILSNYYYLNLAELCIFFSKLKAGEYGQLVWGSRLNNQSIMVALKSFTHERYASITRVEQQKAKDKAERGFQTIQDNGAAITKCIDAYRELAEKAKTDYNTFCELFPKCPKMFDRRTIWKAYSGNKKAIETVFKADISKEEAFNRIAKRLCDYNA
ncbi:MAG: DUF6633 family protein [Phocaeicola sp.]